MKIDEYVTYDGLGLAELVRKKEVKPCELVGLAIKQIEEHNPKINAVIHTLFDKAMTLSKGKLPKGPFTGVPFLIKDYGAELAGEPMYKGNRFRYDQVINNSKYVSEHDSELVSRYKQAGLIILGKTNTPEYAGSTTTEPVLFGACNNPWDLTRTTGGSSGGSAAAVASRIVALAHGNDGGGSIRIPASCCGLFGLKPSRGRLSVGSGHYELMHGLATDHVLTLSVRDSAAILDFTSDSQSRFLDSVGQSPGKLKIAATSVPFLHSNVDEDCVNALHDTIELLQKLGHTVVEKTPLIDSKAFSKAFVIMSCVDTCVEFAEEEAYFGKKAKFKDFEPPTWALKLLGKEFSAFELESSLRLLKAEHQSIARFFENENIDLLLTPTLAMPPVKRGELQPSGYEALFMKIIGRLNAGKLLKMLIDALSEEFWSFIPWTALANATGQPAMSVPLQWNNAGLPIGMHFMGKYGDETTLIRLAAQLEKEQPWRDRLPPICKI